MDIYKRKSRWKIYLAIAGFIIIAISMVYTRYLTGKLSLEELKRVAQLKLAVETLSIESDDIEAYQCDVRLQMELLESNTTIPVLWVDETYLPLDARNYGETKDTSQSFRIAKLAEYQREGQEPIVVFSPFGTQYLYYEHSLILKMLTYYPFIQLVLIAAFIGFGYLGFSTARKAEQNRVWAGMAKETAHQLGTPISGMLAWIDHLRTIKEEDGEVLEVLDEFEKDVKRLELIADRFSKIGSAPELQPVNIYEELEACRAYMQRRAPRKVTFAFPDPGLSPALMVRINPHLFDWVIENLLRNALDAMEDGIGTITAEIYEEEKYVCLDVTDTGKGIPAGKFKTVFQPGYTTKKRGWGLGLSLSKRIVEEYHQGKIFVKKSIPGEGTTFTVQLPK
jgi:signal transduction histidine kinase